MYKERQSFWTWWLIVLFVVIMYVQVQPIYESNWNVDDPDYIGLAILFAVLIFFILVRLNTTINEQGICIRFIPFVRKKTWLWEQIEDVYIKEYAISDYGGWGYRIGKNGVAYNTKGKYGLQLLLKDGSKVMIGTQNQEEVQHVVDTFKKSKS
jgi:hypothetical protein